MVRISSLVRNRQELVLDVGGGETLRIVYRPGQFSIADKVALEQAAEGGQLDIERAASMVLRLVEEWDLTEPIEIERAEVTHTTVAVIGDDGAVVRDADGNPVTEVQETVRRTGEYDVVEQVIPLTRTALERQPIEALYTVLTEIMLDMAKGNRPTAREDAGTRAAEDSPDSTQQSEPGSLVRLEERRPAKRGGRSRT